jgi:SAM-dependent MidA family methyltransferase
MSFRRLLARLSGDDLPVASTGWRTWRQAMAEALYGPGGFYRSSGAPGRHFRTAAHTSPLWPRAWLTFAERVYDALPAAERDEFTVVDMGAGGGELIGGLASIAPPAWRLVGVDLAPRPEALTDRVEWHAAPPADVVGLVVAVEWLDVVPVDVAERTADGWRLVQVDGDGAERLGPPATAADAAWLDRWWPGAGRAEIGRSRDEAWRDLAGRLRRGVAVAVDYAVVPERDVGGTLTGYRDGRQVRPVPDGSMDLTAHVHMQSCAGNGARLMTQREALKRLGVDGRVPPYGGDPGRYAMALSDASNAAELLDPDGLGGFTWLVETRGVALRDCFP